MPSLIFTFRQQSLLFTAACVFTAGLLNAQQASNYVAPTTPANAGSAGVSASALANMTDDLQTLRQQVGQLQLDLRNLQQENQDLRAKIISQADLNAAVQNAVAKNRDEMNKATDQKVKLATDALRKDMTDAIRQAVEALARDTNSQLQILAKAIGKPPPVTSSHVTAADPNQLPPPSNENIFVYVIKSGESLSKIASRNHVTVSDILRVNPNLDPNKVREGQQIAIPLKNGASAPPATTN